MSFIHNERILQHPDFNDGLGNTVWERIKKVGENKFYRVEYDKNLKKVKNMTSEAKRIIAKKYVEKDGLKFLIDTAIADTAYISNVIEAYVKGNTEAAKQLYEEPIRSDNEQADMDRFSKQFGQMKKSWEKKGPMSPDEKAHQETQVKIDKTDVKSLDVLKND